MKPLHLRGRKTADLVRRKGNVWKGKTMTVRWMKGVPRNETDRGVGKNVYVGTYATVKLHKSAVKRNAMRRRCREALRITVMEQEDLPPIQLLISPRSSSLDCDYADILQDVRAFLSQLR